MGDGSWVVLHGGHFHLTPAGLAVLSIAVLLAFLAVAVPVLWYLGVLADLRETVLAGDEDG